jgi:hypothetical protein
LPPDSPDIRNLVVLDSCGVALKAPDASQIGRAGRLLDFWYWSPTRLFDNASLLYDEIEPTHSETSVVRGEMAETNLGALSTRRPEPIDVGSLFKGTATITLVVEIVSAIAMLGSLVAYYISHSGLINLIEVDVAVFLLLLGSMITLFIFLAAIGFFVRVNRRLGQAVIGEGVGSVDLGKRRVKTVVVIYGLAIGLLLIMGMYGYWLVYKYYFAALAMTSLSFFSFVVSLGGFILAFLTQLVVAALGRTATSIIKAVLAEEP